MKCIACGNLIPDGSTVCPFCSANVQATVVPTPEVPVNENVVPVAPVEAAQTVAPVAPVTMMASTPEPTSEVAPVVPETPETPVLPQDQGMVTPEVQSVPAGVIPTPTDVVLTPTPAPTTDMVNGFGDGVKVGNTAPEEPKKNKTKMIIIIVIIALVLAIAGGGLFYYFSQYKSADKRINEIVNGLFKSATQIKNDKFELGSGKYEVSASLDMDETKASAKLNGLYAYDLPNGIVDLTLNVESVDMGQELLDAGELNLEVYLAENKAYLLLQNFYDKYIYTDVPGLDEALSQINQNDINYQVFVTGIREALKAGLNAAANTQTVKNVTVNGKSVKANVVTIKFTEGNQKAMVTAMINSIANNSALIKEVAKISEMEESEIKENIKSSLDEAEFEDASDTVLEFYTEMFGNKLVGINFSFEVEDGTNSMEVYPITNGYGIKLYENKKELFKVEITESVKKTSTTVENTSKFNIVYYNDESAMKINLETKVTDDVNPNVEKVNVKNSINAQYLTQTDIMNIYNKVKSFGTLGLLVDSMLGSYINPTTSSDIDYDYDYEYDETVDVTTDLDDYEF